MIIFSPPRHPLPPKPAAGGPPVTQLQAREGPPPRSDWLVLPHQDAGMGEGQLAAAGRGGLPPWRGLRSRGKARRATTHQCTPLTRPGSSSLEQSRGEGQDSLGALKIHPRTPPGPQRRKCSCCNSPRERSRAKNLSGAGVPPHGRHFTGGGGRNAAPGSHSHM